MTRLCLSRKIHAKRMNGSILFNLFCICVKKDNILFLSGLPVQYCVGIFPESHIQIPVHAPYALASSYRLPECLYSCCQTTDIITIFFSLLFHLVSSFLPSRYFLSLSISFSVPTTLCPLPGSTPFFHLPTGFLCCIGVVCLFTDFLNCQYLIALFF